MNTDESLNTSFWVMVLMQTIGSVDPMPGMGPRKLPAPRAYVLVIIAWGVLQIGADIGLERAAAKMGWLMVLAGTFLGPFGKRVVTLTQWVAKTYGNVGPGVTTGSQVAPDHATANSTI